MREVTFFVEGTPQGKQRARSTRSGHHYTPKKTVDYESLIKNSYRNTDYGMSVPLETAIKLNVWAGFPIPKSWSTKKKMESHNAMCKPDFDNILKVVGDALNGVAWKDDKQIVQSAIIKRYDSICPGISIRITEISE